MRSKTSDHGILVGMWRRRARGVLVCAHVTQQRVVVRDGDGRRGRRARHELHAESFGRDRSAHRALQRRRRRARLRLHVELVHHAGEEHEHLHARQHVPQAHPPPHTERHEKLGPLDFTVLVYKPARVEFVRLVPKVRIHVDAVDQRYDLWARGDSVTVEVHVSVKKNDFINKINTF